MNPKQSLFWSFYKEAAPVIIETNTVWPIAPQKRDAHVVKSHVNMLGVNVAMAIFIESEISVLDIALKVGIPDQCHFAQVFKKSVGMTPKMYRKLKMKA